MVEAWIDSDEWYPVHTVYRHEELFRVRVELTEQELARAEAALAEFDEVQLLLATKYEGG